jgi:hypothetical protein
MKYKKGDLLLLSAGSSLTQQCHEEYYIVKDIYPDNTENYIYALHSITSNEEEHLNKCWVEYWTKKVV